MSELERNKVDYFVICVNEFAKTYGISAEDAFAYLNQYEGINFLEKHYDIQHTLSFEETVENLTIICRKHGGKLS